ncbi:peptide deformylase [Plasmodium sp. gorilla clade G2]|uniref:peptide deformylase n=1 Tax=Plasmodium sp. gorilla clade G2 TaxID=880535 RepID=UPI000D211A3A|nr:peptide deformylase [Plasmodium sp. gorilla clade G2]SOV14027.1 peptide deformylase [Plasmodium sp. gorilla clade G2]
MLMYYLLLLFNIIICCNVTNIYGYIQNVRSHEGYIKNYQIKKYNGNIKQRKRSPLYLLKNEKADVKIVKYPDPILRRRSEEVTNFDDNLKSVVRKMFDIMYESKGIGLSAPQVNISKRIIVWNALYEKRKEENERIFINPSIVEQSLVKVKLIEGCLSFPGIEGKVERPSIVSISYYDVNGCKHLKILKGIHARIFQHEFDHLNGVLFIDKLTQMEKKKVRAKLNELIRDYKNTHSEEPAI